MPWYALRLRSNREFAVREALVAAGFEAFLPTWCETVRWSDRTKVIPRVLFPGYIFVLLAEGPEVYRALTMRGVVQLLPNSHNPSPLAPSEIENLKLIVESKATAGPCQYVAGESVMIESGALAGVSGVVVRTRGSFHVVVNVEMLRRSIRVELDAETLKKGVAA